MIVELRVENIAIIERALIALGPGLTVLTGETGAGKSLLIDAIELALGERADSELVRSGATKGSVNVVIGVSAQMSEKCLELGIPVEDGTIYLDRDVYIEGRSQCRISGKLAPLSVLKQLGALVVDLHGQHGHQSLLDPARHIGFLDDWIGAPAYKLLGQAAAAHEKAEEARRSLAALRAGMRDREHRLDLLRFQVSEIESLNPKPGEVEELEAQLSRMRNVEQLAQAAAQAQDVLKDGEQNAADMLRTALKTVESAARFDPELDSITDGLRAALVQLEESGYSLAAYAEVLDANPALLEEIAGRVDGLKRLRRKYGEDEVAVLAFLDKSRRELDLLTDSEASEESLALALSDREAELGAVAAELSELRRTNGGDFGVLVESQLRDLAMESARFAANFRDKQPDAAGCDEMEFFFSANVGELPRPLSKIASGGEISRVMLAIKTAMAGRAGVPTLIFDEIDAGLGGKAAATVALKLEELAAHYQVVVITHLAQIAARGTTHLRIEKGEANGRVNTQVRELHGDERVDEIARMIAGDRLTESALANARDMLGSSVSV